MNTIWTVGSNPSVLPRPSSPSWLCRLRAVRGYDIAIRVIGSAWFLLLASLLARKVSGLAASMSLTDFGPTGWPTLLSSVCLFLFYLANWWFILIRPPAAARAGVLPSLTAFAGTFLPWAIPLLTPNGASTGQNLVSAALLLIGTLLMVVVITHLGRSFSIVPQARSLVRTGPYAVVRNPLYLAEEIAVLGTVLQLYSVVTLFLFFVHCALQVGRILYEEDLLRRSFPDYGSYASSTYRLIPFVW